MTELGSCPACAAPIEARIGRMLDRVGFDVGFFACSACGWTSPTVRLGAVLPSGGSGTFAKDAGCSDHGSTALPPGGAPERERSLATPDAASLAASSGAPAPPRLRTSTTSGDRPTNATRSRSRSTTSGPSARPIIRGGSVSAAYSKPRRGRPAAATGTFTPRPDESAKRDSLAKLPPPNRDDPPIVEVDWIDSMGEAHWQPFDEIVDRSTYENMQHRSAGYLLADLDHSIVLAQGRHVTGENVCHVMQIPKVAIVDVRVLSRP